MARGLVAVSHDIHAPASFGYYVLVVFVVISAAAVDPSTVKNFKRSYAETSGDSSEWHHCPQGWTLFNNKCYKVIETALTWTQAQALCRSSGGNLVKISSQYEQDWVSQFVSEHLPNPPYDVDNSINNEASLNGAGEDGTAVWIGFLRQQDQTYQWSDGQNGVEQDGFWAVDGLQTSDGESISRLCCDMRALSPDSKDLRWYLSNCEDLCASVCELQACEEHAMRCADGTKCISKTWICDGHLDCPDGSDELECRKSLSSVAAAKQCGATSKGYSGTIYSPNFPGEYPPFLNCTWKIETTPPDVIEILVESLATEEKYDCLKIYEGSEAVDMNLIVSLDGNKTEQSLVKASSSFVTITFVTDHSVQGMGFNITWFSGKTKMCGGQLTAADTETLITFPEPDQDISLWGASKQLSCNWLIASPNSSSLLSLQFRNITLEEGDSITVYDGSGKDDPVICHINSSHGVVIPSAVSDFASAAVSSSLNIPPVIISSSQYVFIRAIISKDTESVLVLSYKNGCDTLISSSSSLILSPGFPNSFYPDNLNCSWTVSKDRLGRQFTLLFLPHFVTEADKDYVQVHNLEKKQATRYSGSFTDHQQRSSSHDGFIIEFVSDSTVNRGRWAALISYDCDKPSLSSHVVPNSTDTRFGSTIGYSCATGFDLEGPSHSVCGIRGHWLPPELPKCVEINCGSVPVPSSSYLTNVTGTTYNSQANYQCLFGFNMLGSNMATCGEMGWKDVPSCEVVTCPKEPPPPGGTARAEDIRFGTLREYFCKPNCRLTGSKFSHCDLLGHWTDPVPRCEVPTCAIPHGILNGRLNQTGSVAVGQSVHVICDTGYTPNGPSELTCLDTQQFNGRFPSCTDINECENPQVCGPHLCQNFPGGYSCFCGIGYQHPHSSSQHCVDIDECAVNNGGCSHECINQQGGYECHCPQNMSLYAGDWDRIGSTTLIPSKSCIATCRPFVVGQGGEVRYTQKPLSNGELLNGTVAMVSCPTGRYPNGASVVTCEAGIGWSSPITQCAELTCETPVAPKNGHIFYSDQGKGAHVMYSCHPHYVLHGPKHRFCIEDTRKDPGKVNLVWSGPEPSCEEVNCPTPQPPVNGSVDFRATTYKSVAVFRCECGYELVGQSVSRCMSDGIWSHPTPTCEEKSCSYPGMPADATIMAYEPGFPVGSLVTFQCKRKGYKLSSEDPLKCLPYKQSKLSLLQPYLDISVVRHFVIPSKASLDPACAPAHVIEQWMNIWYERAIETCQSCDIDFDVKTETATNGTSLKMTAHLLMSSSNTATTCACGQDMMAYFSNSSAVSSDIVNGQLPSCSPISVTDSRQLSSQWECEPGLRLEGGTGQQCGLGSIPHCIEECVDEGIETFHPEHFTKPPQGRQQTSADKSSLTPGSSETDKPTSSKPGRSVIYTTPGSVTDPSLSRHTTLKFATTTPAHISTVKKDSDKTLGNVVPHEYHNSFTTESPSTRYITTDPDLSASKGAYPPNKATQSQDMVTQKLNPVDGEQTFSTTKMTTVMTPSSSKVRSTMPSTQWPFFTSSGSPSQAETTPTTQETSSPLPTHAPSTTSRSVLNDRPIPNVDFPPLKSTLPTTPGLDAVLTETNSPKDTSQTEGLPRSETAADSESRDKIDSPTNPSTIDCASLSRQHHSCGSQSSTNISSSWSEDSDLFRGDINTTEGSTFSTLEKQEITMVPGSTAPTANLSRPVFSVEVNDRMSGGFGNILCIDAVHDNINGKVNELLREFGNQMGKLVCQDAPDSSLELTAGNIRFKGTRARIFIKFSIAYSVSSKIGVESCAMEFQDYAMSQLPKKFEKVQREVPASQCPFVNYTRLEFNISFQGWSCRNGYALDEKRFQCFNAPPKSDFTTSSAAFTSHIPSTLLATIPRLSMMFRGSFTSLNSPFNFDKHCADEYSAALVKVLSWIEPHLQSRYIQCKNLFIDITNNVTVTLRSRGVTAEAAIHLIPLQADVQFSTMSKCSRFISVQFRDPAAHLSSVTLSRDYLPTCPEISLSPHGIRSEGGSAQLYCAQGYLLSDSNFKCIKENLPLHASGIELVLSGGFEGNACPSVVRASASQLIEDVTEDVRQSLTSGHLCNTSRNIIVLQLQGNVSIQRLGVTLFIPLTLVSLQGNKSDSEGCTAQLYKYLSASLSQPVSTMVDTLKNKCLANIAMPGDYTVAYTRWECFPGHKYNSAAHKCESVPGHSTVSQTEDRQSGGPSPSARHRRDAPDFQLRPQWNASLPECLDLEPPVFKDCPDWPVIIPSDHVGPYQDFALPTATDSTGNQPKVTVLPSDFRLPYKFTKNTTIEMEAQDVAGNIARCIINVIIDDQDQVLPHISCPTQLVTIVDASGLEYPNITYENIGVIARDNSGYVSIGYDPPSGATVKATDVILVKATAEDENHNMANCSFQMIIEPQGCPNWTLPAPAGGNRTCSFAGLNKEGYSCSVSCDQDQGKAFAVQPPEQYICQGSSWYPHSRVPECLDGRFSDYELQLSFYLTYKGSKTQSCLDEALMEVVDSVKPRLSPACNSSAEHLMNVTFMQLGHLATSDHNSKSTMLTVKIKISIQTQPPHSDMAAGVAHFCGMLTMPQLKFNTTLKSSCGEITLTDPTEARGIESCPQGYTLVSKKCYQCPPGSYWNVPQCIDCPQDSISNVSGEASCFMGFDCPAGMYRKMPECIECPRGTYQTTSGSKHCMACGKGYSTPSPGAKSVDQCVAECDVNHYSYNGLEPCLPCPLGTHQPSTGSYRCETCVFDMDGLSQSDYCREPCQPGEFSSDGTRPCQPCPRNYYTPYNGSTSCLECPDSRVTLGEDSVSASQCQVKDPCQGSPCKHRGICLPFGRDFECECTSGWKGPTCQERMDICDDQPCHNNGQCVHHRDTFTCNCEAGFTGSTCDIDITVTDHCLLNPCVHGICKSLTSGFQCNCLAGYEGQRCEKNTDDCAGVTCHNSGICVDLVDGYYCLCADGFTGNLCESNVDDCQPDSCLNGGTCVDGDKSFRCLCPPGFDGDFCEVNTDECSSSPCVNDGLCQDGINSYTCLCKPGYTGHQCESSVNPCNSKPCFNGGVCFNSKAAPVGFRCNCSEGYRGARCEQIVNHCQPMPCNMSGTFNCVNTAAGFQCNCLLGWKGNLCDQPMDPCSSQPCDSGTVCVRNGLFSFNCLCANPLMGPTCLNSSTSCQSNPCQNKGTCVDKSDGFVCHCRPGFTGSFCEVNIDECTSQPCRNGGTCRDGVNAFTCKCPRGFAGELCKIDIDECLSQPCQHNSACKELDGDFLCDCSPGYTGKTCDTDLDECESRPCQHQGKCVDKIAGYDCICPQGYTGAQCESALDGCLDNTQCLNGASCRRVDNKDLCHCTPEFTGPDCGKEKSANFDLHFLGDLRSGSLPPVVETRNLSSFSLCLWVRFTVEDSEGTFLTLTSEDGYFPYLILSGSQAVSPMFSPLDIAIELHINDGWWHHLCWVVDAGHWIMYLKGKPVREGEIAKWLSGDSLMLRLGRPMIGEDDDERFKGHLHGVNIYSFALHSEDILNMSQHCQVDLLGGDVFNWAVVDQYLHGNVVVTMPSECGQIFCSYTDENGLCSFPSAVDKIPPVVTNCPEMVMVTSENTLVPVTWLEPEFSDNVGIVAVRQNFRPGQVFQHGQYLVTYIGYDAENNSAECSFQVFVRKFACIDPPPPANGARVCGEWEHGRYCIPSCTSSYHFVTPIPPFYRCGFEGVWDPPNGDPFSFPACARTYPPAHLMFGGMIFEGPECTEKFLNELRDKLVRILTQIDNVIGLCDPGRVCDYTDSLNVVCGQEDQTRRKRAVSQNTEIYTVILNISVSATASMSGELMPTEAIIEEIVSTIKRNQTELDFTLTSTDIKMSPHCKAGQVLTTGDKTLCLDCPAGHYVNEKSACSPCPKGWYNNKPLQLECVQCSAGLTTVNEGSTSASQCITVCEIGTYFSVNTSQCELCPVGQYQSQAGQQRCDSCPVGLTTHGKGTSSASDCLDLCGAGEELGRDGACAPCPTGTYRPAEAADLFCISCPYGLTTAEEGAIHQNQCTLAECGKGFYHQPEDKSCVPCPLGTFQQLRGASSCEPCGVGLTTLQEGADSRSLCQPGVVDECKLMTDLCSPDTECVDLEDGYACEYVCENYCDRLNSCDEDTHKDMDQTVDCDCEVEVCPASRDKMFRSLVIGSMTVTAVATLVLLIIISIWIFRKNQQRKQGMEVRMYRDERKPVAFTNEAFDSLQGQMNLDSEEHLQQMPPTMATRWHSRSFMSGMPSPTFPDDDEIESTDL